ncbi:hypothetical protein [Brevundimonas sp. NIBR11]|uniref:hypothetical protein n=1 Tax=Brevundimonas sp. NIBR11 TaxID=3015999 RepID=UPI0022F0BC3B|nr:hypothetical protein [Brevundimonas sp. NIBR11]WGM32904.1 hypothetical protein KKHFBJBL_03160 [Brevundimonas sp. NIBR11]
MIGLMFALLASPAAVEAQAIQATIQGCAVENGRYVCRYAVPDIMIVPVPGSNIVADAPAVVLGPNASSTEAPSPDTLAPAPEMTVAEPPVSPPAGPPVSSPARLAAATTTAAAVDPGPIQPIDAGVLTERESQLVSRCADAGWMSLCLPDDRRAARTLRDKQTAYLAVRREVTRLIGDDDCDAAVKAALDGGYLALARETRDYCAAPTAAAAARPTVEPSAGATTTRPTVAAEQPDEVVSKDAADDLLEG